MKTMTGVDATERDVREQMNRPLRPEPSRAQDVALTRLAIKYGRLQIRGPYSDLGYAIRAIEPRGGVFLIALDGTVERDGFTYITEREWEEA